MVQSTANQSLSNVGPLPTRRGPVVMVCSREALQLFDDFFVEQHDRELQVDCGGRDAETDIELTTKRPGVFSSLAGQQCQRLADDRLQIANLSVEMC